MFTRLSKNKDTVLREANLEEMYNECANSYRPNQKKKQPALLDSACEANFIHTDLVPDLKVEKCKLVAIYAANNIFMATVINFVQTKWFDTDTDVKFYVADISDCSIVLGAGFWYSPITVGDKWETKPD
ncbi:uncharacterized protein SPAPADRAFT_66146 [Spathaspora passalidarum NRRL Y-27907]|uniref:Uncharacterized protein n=1 Tax=Spathaspora passalidarum (strain NRRL Y-27907 / 11-Y1) TaxID=619300 RepID=G3ALA5_SPAPN|nr:uncharacterized protein SPAPADRAFT_66146 [Spathaspora passalidarum NRRL Y-27907]EGW33148.1 hypothetical protein SPAPADRAFT_66146 [Spathaspora passalidarum NRRL Y-27907]